ncbi:uncharacterized protein LOC135961516 [Calliphora vicina]|uniref:uncharacterized protein LOC135961516 n=1 Tax=Calliphora vicina TaxID=7373 RepID=UPI00325B7659
MNVKEKIFWGEFLELYKTMPCLWKVKSAEYSNRELKNQCYNKMVDKLKEWDLEANRDKVVKKINVFRTNYKRDLKKVRKSETSGAGNVFESSLWYYDKLKFLEDQECSREGKSTMNTESFNIESSDETIVEPPPCKKRKATTEDNLLQMACQKLGSSDDRTSTLAKGWSIQYEEMSKEQKLFSRAIFSDVLYHGCLNKLTEKTVEEIHKVLQGVSEQTHTPYVLDECTTQSSQSSSFSGHNFETLLLKKENT